MSADGAEIGQGAALPRDGADEVDEVALWKAAGHPLEQAGAERVSAAFRQVVKCISEGLGKQKTRFRCTFQSVQEHLLMQRNIRSQLLYFVPSLGHRSTCS